MTRVLPIMLLVAAASGCLRHHAGPLPGEPTDASYTTVAQTRIRFVDSGGSGSPVVLIHGFASALDTWDRVREELEPGHRVIALDLKGFGWSERPQGDYSPAAQAEIVLALLDQLGVSQSAVVAHSWGASVALAIALRAPERVTKIALYDAWVYEEQLPSAFLWSRASGIGELIFGLFYKERPGDKIELAFHDPSLITHEFVADVEAALDRPGTTAAALAAVRGQRYRQVQQRYATITQPTLLLWGEDDKVTTLDVAHKLHSQLPNSTLVTFGDCGHFPMIEARASSTRALADFLSTQPDTAPPRTGEPDAVEQTEEAQR